MTILIASSFVASSPVGGGLQARVLARMGFEPVLVPTVLFGRHPGLGPPGGGPVSEELFAGLLKGIAANGVLELTQAVICGYFADPAQIGAAARLIEAVRKASPDVWVVVDPIMGDAATGLYVSEAVAAAIADDLTPRADLIAPNRFELERLSGTRVEGPASALAAARAVGRAVLVSSVPVGEEIGVLLADGETALIASHRFIEAERKGGGDLLTALFVGHRLAGSSPEDALGAAVREVAGAPVRIEAP